MAQYNPQAGRGGGGGRGGGRGYQQQQQQPNSGGNNPQGGGQQGRPMGMGAWQPSAPTSTLQQAAYTRQQQPHYPPHYAPPQGYHNPYAGGYNPAGGRGGGGPPYGGGGNPYQPPGGVYYPPQQAGGHPAAAANAAPAQAAAPVVQPPKPREKKPLVITDKDGNVLDFRSEAAKNKPAAAAAPAAPADKAAAAPAPKEDAGSKLREAALARLNEKKAEPAKEPAKAEVKAAVHAPAPAAVSKPPAAPAPVVEKPEPPKPTPAAPPAAKEEKKEPEKTAPKSMAEIAAAAPPAKAPAAFNNNKGSSLQAAATTTKKPSLAAVVAAPAPPKSSGGALRPGGKMRTPAAPAAGGAAGPGRLLVYDKRSLLKFKESGVDRPADLPDMTIVKGPSKQRNDGRGGGGGGNQGGRRQSGGDWGRGQEPPRRGSQGGNKGNDQWSRGQAPPKNKNPRNQQGGRRGSNEPLFDGPVAPLVISENRWKPKKNSSPLVVAEKKVKGILNKMTKEKFDRLSVQMTEIQILSYDMLTMMIHNVYEKAIDEPTFGDMYADLCVRLSKGAAQANNDFVKVIESDEEPPTESGDAAPESQQPAGSSSHVVYRWSNDVSTTDDEVFGPFSSADECIDAALNDGDLQPVKREDMELELVQLKIKNGIFIKVMKKKGADESGEEPVFYTLCFPVSEAEECGQQLSEIFLSEVECVSNAKKKNSFKRSLLNKCEDEFKKQDIYVDWKAEKKAYEESKSKLTPQEQAEKEGELSFRRIKIKKQMLGNIKFIGQLYKTRLLKEKIMRFCISSLLKLEELTDVESKNPEYKDTGDMDMDEEDHEAICSMFTTIGSTIDRAPAKDFMKVCFTKINKLSTYMSLPARSRFMYKDLLELRENNWVPRRDEGKAKTLDEIKKEFELEEKRQAQQSAQNYRNDNRRGSQSGGYDNRRGSDYRGGRGGGGGRDGGNRNRPNKPAEVVTDDDGFTVIGRGGGGGGGGGGGAPSKPSQPNRQQPQSSLMSAASKQQSTFSALQDDRGGGGGSSGPAPLPKEKLERRIKSMRMEYMQDPSNTSELLLSMDELSGTKDAGMTLVTKNADALLECKAAERKAVTEVISTLYENKKLTQDEIRNGLMDCIEFADSMICDCPKLFEYLGELLAALFVLKAVDAQWLCEQLEKAKAADPNSQVPEGLIKATISSLKTRAAPAKEMFGGAATGSLNSLLGDDKWSLIANDLLA